MKKTLDHGKILEEQENILKNFSNIYDKLKNKDLSYLFVDKKIDINVSKTITFLLSRTCDKNCSHCLANINNNKQNLNFKLIEKTFSELSNLGVENIIISGGEPFIHLEEFSILFKLIKKYNLKIKSLKTNMYLSETDNYEQTFINAYKDNESIFLGAIEPSLDRFHGNNNQLNSLLKIININFQILQSSNIVEKKIMNISMIRELSFSKDIDNLKKIISFLSINFNLTLEINQANKNIDDINNILLFIENNISQDYFVLKLKKDNKEIILRLGLNDLYKIGKAENLESNLIENKIKKNTPIDELFRYSQYNIEGIDEKGQIYTDEFSTYTGNFSFGNIKNGINTFIEKNSFNPILIELKNNGLSRILPKLLVIYPELKSFSYTIYDDIFQKILSLKKSKEILFCICYDLLINKNENKI